MVSHFSIPEGTTSIDEDAWRGWGVDRKTLEKVPIPTSVKSNGCGAFRYCSVLLEVTIPASVLIIGDYAFSQCSALLKVRIPASVESIGDEAFARRSALVDMAIIY